MTEQARGSISGHRRFGGGDVGIAAGLLAASAVGWWWSVRMSTDHSPAGHGGGGDPSGAMAMSHPLSFEAFLVA